MTASHVLRRRVSEYSLMLHERGWVANHDGNVSARLSGEDRFFITPTAVSKRHCTPETIVLCDLEGRTLGSGRPPSEVAIHAGAYRHADVQAVIHTHSPYASAFAAAGLSLGPIAMPEVVVSIGPQIPMLPLFAPKDPAISDAVEAALGTADVALMAGNGVVAVGADLEQAFLRAELVEHYARIAQLARDLGGLSALPPELLDRLIEARAKAGLGPRRAGASTPPAGGSSRAADRIRPIVEEEIRRALGGSK